MVPSSDCSVDAIYCGGDAGTVGVKSKETKKINLNFYPNPVIDKITIEANPESVIEILDLTRNILKVFQLNSDHEEIDVSKFSSGVYLIKATDKKGNVSAAEFIKE